MKFQTFIPLASRVNQKHTLRTQKQHRYHILKPRNAHKHTTPTTQTKCNNTRVTHLTRRNMTRRNITHKNIENCCLPSIAHCKHDYHPHRPHVTQSRHDDRTHVKIWEKQNAMMSMQTKLNLMTSVINKNNTRQKSKRNLEMLKMKMEMKQNLFPSVLWHITWT